MLLAEAVNTGVLSRIMSFKEALLYVSVPLVNPAFEGVAKPSISPSDIKS